MWDLKCVAAATCFTISNLLYTIYGVHRMYGTSTSSSTDAAGSNSTGISHRNFTQWKELDPIYIEERWDQHESSRPLMTWAGLFGCMAWFWFMIPILQTAWILSRGGRRMVGAHCLLGGLAVFGSLMELLARLLMVGMTNAAVWLAKDFNLSNWTSENSNDGTGWRVLEMIHTVTHGMMLWVDAFEALAFFGIVCVLFYSVSSEPKYKVRRSSSVIVQDEEAENGLDGSDSMDRIGVEHATSDPISTDGSTPSSPSRRSLPTVATTKTPMPSTFNKCFINFGLFIGALSIIDFIADVLRFLNWMFFGRIAMSINVLVGMIFLPIWLLMFAKQLPEATERFESMQRWDDGTLQGEGEETVGLVSKGEKA